MRSWSLIALARSVSEFFVLRARSTVRTVSLYRAWARADMIGLFGLENLWFGIGWFGEHLNQILHQTVGPHRACLIVFF
jgi:hypothetical protein